MSAHAMVRRRSGRSEAKTSRYQSSETKLHSGGGLGSGLRCDWLGFRPAFSQPVFPICEAASTASALSPPIPRHLWHDILGTPSSKSSPRLTAQCRGRCDLLARAHRTGRCDFGPGITGQGLRSPGLLAVCCVPSARRFILPTRSFLTVGPC